MFAIDLRAQSWLLVWQFTALMLGTSPHTLRDLSRLVLFPNKNKELPAETDVADPQQHLNKSDAGHKMGLRSTYSHA